MTRDRSVIQVPPGVVPPLPTKRKCPTCRGTGINPVWQSKVCPKCDGERVIGLQEPRLTVADAATGLLASVAGQLRWIEPGAEAFLRRMQLNTDIPLPRFHDSLATGYALSRWAP